VHSPVRTGRSADDPLIDVQIHTQEHEIKVGPGQRDLPSELLSLLPAHSTLPHTRHSAGSSTVGQSPPQGYLTCRAPLMLGGSVLELKVHVTCWYKSVNRSGRGTREVMSDVQTGRWLVSANTLYVCVCVCGWVCVCQWSSKTYL
jgi:hypothetical protein